MIVKLTLYKASQNSVTFFYQNGLAIYAIIVIVVYSYIGYWSIIGGLVIGRGLFKLFMHVRERYREF